MSWVTLRTWHTKKSPRFRHPRAAFSKVKRAATAALLGNSKIAER
jgi:hypothetical protein